MDAAELSTSLTPVAGATGRRLAVDRLRPGAHTKARRDVVQDGHWLAGLLNHMGLKPGLLA